MAKSVYIGVSDKAREVKKMYIGVNGVARKVKKAYIGVNGVARLFYSGFPEEPTEYVLGWTYTSSTTFTAPEDGYYQIELFGKSGSGGTGETGFTTYKNNAGTTYSQHGAWNASGGGGGSGAYCCSRGIKLNKGDTVFIDIDEDCTVEITSSTDESYSVMKCTAGSDGGSGSYSKGTTNSSWGTVYGGSAGKGGVASGGNAVNTNGKDGTAGSGSMTKKVQGSLSSISGGAGGSAPYTGANAGGKGGTAPAITVKANSSDTRYSQITSGGGSNDGSSGSTGVCKIYRGNTN